ncbi:Ribonuclease H [Hydrogenophaga taeniospiralis CCUG 15921]|uniref:RNA-directed DNA polymerase n=1 Tax=Hydrogenophaga taeniospiralis CCUG 15921 TaxID=1281780 RepID=A0A9X4SBW5_9BURK|nr:Ribonuclease H [Hydrogenophaga taeniospiralis CCUG 15921]
MYTKPKSELYTKFEIPKRTGGVREVSAPFSHLKLIQQRLAAILLECTKELREKHASKSKNKNFEFRGVSHGFMPGHSIMTNGQAHTTRRFVFNVDLSDFFGSINFGRVRGFFIKDNNFALDEKTATILAQIACFDNKLPQGSPCSPVISNLLGHILDVALVELARKNKCTYTRYADDLTFSTNKRIFPSEIALATEDDGNSWLPGNELIRVVRRNGFDFNERKTRMQYKDSRQEVTGLSVNRKVNVPASYRYTVRAMASSLFRTGKFEHIIKYKSASGDEIVSKCDGKINQLLGMLSFIHQVDVYNEALAVKNNHPIIETPGRLELYRRVIYFDAFYAPERPIIVCEGKTDNTYIKNAIHRLSQNYPLLGGLDSEGKPQLKIRLFKYADRRTASITKLGGGVGGLCHLIKYYKADIASKFSAPRPKHPVIMLVDNDSGADAIYGAIAGILNVQKPKGKRPFIRVYENLYVVPTPFGSNGEKTSIEDFFDKATLAVQLNGKSFERKNDADNEHHYGKAAFARDVIAKNAAAIDFNGFKPILDRIEAAIKDYATQTQ